MRPVVTPHEMASADERAMAAGTPGFVLMERAGGAVARAAIRVMGGRYGKRALVVCGKGNNGGDGFVAARVLMNEGVQAACSFVGDPAGVTGDAARHRDLFTQQGGRIEIFTGSLGAADVVVDALFGTGFRGRAEGDAGDAIEAMNAHPAPTIAVDIPSGVDGATGSVEGPAVRAHTTVVMAAQKIGTSTGTGAELAGDVEVVDIGIEVGAAEVWESTAADVVGVLPHRTPSAHKRSVGSVGVLGGSDGMSGAAILTARAAARMGAGYVTVGLPRPIDGIVSAALPEVLTRVVADEPHLTGDSWVAFKEIADRADALALGPGLGEGDGQRELVRRVLAEAGQLVVVDADGLNALARDPAVLVDRQAPTILTPHPAELARLLGTETAAVQKDRVEAARSAARCFGCTVVLKGHRSAIAQASGRVVVNPTGTAHLATAGTGDVLTGAVAALAAAGVAEFDAAWAAAYLHGIAGEVAAARNDDHGVVAWDVAESLPRAIAVTDVVAWD